MEPTTTPPLPQPPAAVESIDAAAQSCTGAWNELTGLGDLLAAGRLLDAWNTVSGAAGSCWSTLGDAVSNLLPFLA